MPLRQPPGPRSYGGGRESESPRTGGIHAKAFTLVPWPMNSRALDLSRGLTLAGREICIVVRRLNHSLHAVEL